ncbi:MAG: hypothetical protein WCO77_12985, partial [bacterium]
MRVLSLLLALTVISGTGLCAVTRSDLSPATLSVLPPSSSFIKLKSGNTIQGEILRNEGSTNEVVVRTVTGKIISKQRYSRADVLEVRPENLEPMLANALKDLRLSPKTNLTATAYAGTIALCDEFMKLWPTSQEISWVSEKRTEFSAEQNKLAQGLEKLEGEWMPPIKASVARYTALSRIIAKAQTQYPGIDTQNYSQNPTAKKSYERALENRRAIARRLPSLMTERIPILLQNKDFDQAAAEMDTFLLFWIELVTKTQANRANAIKGGESDFADMDFTVLITMEKKILEAYLANRNPA